jgi:hypothetical protein
MSHRYTLFGQILHSTLPCPELLQADVTEPPDILIDYDDLSEPLVAPSFANHWLQIRPGICRILIEDIASYQIEAGRTIRVDPLPGTDAGDVRLFLLGTAMGILLHQQGRLPLHVSAIAHDGQSLAFCGASGAGKSTLAAGLSQKGFPLLCDDVGLVMLDTQGRPWFYPGFPRIKLWGEAIDHLGIERDGLIPDQTRTDKYHLRLHDFTQHFHTEPLPLTRLYDLAPTADTSPARIEALDRHETLALAIAHTYRPMMLRRIGNPVAHLEQCGYLANAVRGYRYHRPFTLKAFEASLAVLIEHIEGAGT